MSAPELLQGTEATDALTAACIRARTFDPAAFAVLDDRYPPRNLLAPLPADTVQLRAVAVADAGYSLLLQGGEGCGKQQAALNLLAHLLVHGPEPEKPLLLLAPPERLAGHGPGSLRQQLDALGLTPFCLFLPDEDGTVAGILAQLAETLALPPRRNALDADALAATASELESLRQHFNACHAALHRVHANGNSLYQSLMCCIRYQHWTPVILPLSRHASRHELDRLCQYGRHLADAAQRLPALAATGTPEPVLEQHPLAELHQTEWTSIWARSLAQNLKQLIQACQTLRQQAAIIQPLLGLPAETEQLSLGAFAALDQLLDVLRTTPKVPRPLVLQAHEADVHQRLLLLYEHGMRRDRYWLRLDGQYRDEFAKQNAAQLRREWAEIIQASWPLRLYQRTAFLKRLSIYRVDHLPPQEQDLPDLLDTLEALNAEDQWLYERRQDALTLLQIDVRQQHGRWQQLEPWLNWAGRYLEALEMVASRHVRPVAQLLATIRPLLAEERGRLLPDCSLGASLLRYHDAWEHLESLRQRIAGLAGAQDVLLRDEGNPDALRRLQVLAENWLARQDLWQAWCGWQTRRQQALHHGLHAVVHALESGRIAAADMPAFIEYSHCSRWLAQTLASDPQWGGFSSTTQETHLRTFLHCAQQFRQLQRQQLLTRLHAALPEDYGLIRDGLLPLDPALAELYRLLHGAAPPDLELAVLLRTFPRLLPRLKPCVIATPAALQALEAALSAALPVTPVSAVNPDGQTVPMAFSRFGSIIVMDGDQVTAAAVARTLRRAPQFVCTGNPARPLPDSLLAVCQTLPLPHLALETDYRSPGVRLDSTAYRVIDLSPDAAHDASPDTVPDAADFLPARHLPSALVQALLQALQQQGWAAHALSAGSGGRLSPDIAVRDPDDAQRYLLGILCDTPRAADGSPLTACERELLRQQVLAEQGWPLYRIWATDWWQDAPGQLQHLLRYLRSLRPASPASALLDGPESGSPDETGAGQATLGVLPDDLSTYLDLFDAGSAQDGEASSPVVVTVVADSVSTDTDGPA